MFPKCYPAKQLGLPRESGGGWYHDGRSRRTCGYSLGRDQNPKVKMYLPRASCSPNASQQSIWAYDFPSQEEYTKSKRFWYIPVWRLFGYLFLLAMDQASTITCFCWRPKIFCWLESAEHEAVQVVTLQSVQFSSVQFSSVQLFNLRTFPIPKKYEGKHLTCVPTSLEIESKECGKTFNLSLSIKVEEK